jgi:hypothetical protein
MRVLLLGIIGLGLDLWTGVLPPGGGGGGPVVPDVILWDDASDIQWDDASQILWDS